MNTARIQVLMPQTALHLLAELLPQPLREKPASIYAQIHDSGQRHKPAIERTRGKDSPVAVTSMVMPFVASLGSDRVTAPTPIHGSSFASTTSAWKPGGGSRRGASAAAR
ncbi:hypothetical protein Fmac_008572 [Flemingia macrophylla]|uniref:Uncharacterized protein n=1 Tax=Flemingia macrophylla TaxID=520843 RepID=A0ABD1MXS0_9FABA